MIHHEKVDISERTNINKTSALKECMFCHYWYFKDVGYKFKPHVCSKCHKVLMAAYELETLQY